MLVFECFLVEVPYSPRVPLAEDAYRLARDELLHRFRAWRPDRAVHDYADIALDFKYYYRDGEFLRWSEADVDELLLDWVPRKVLVPDGYYGELAVGIRDFLRFLDETGRLAPGSATFAELESAVARYAPEMARRATDSGYFGMAKGLIAEPEPPPIPLPPRPEADLEEAARIAEASRSFRRLCALHDYFAEPRPLTKKGNLRLADARYLVDVLDTGDQMDEVIGDRRFKTQSSAELVGLVSIVEFAKSARVIRVYGGKLVAVKRWAALRRDPLEAVGALADVMIADGPLIHWPAAPHADAEMWVLESSIPALLSRLYEGPADHGRIVEGMIEAVERLVELHGAALRILDEMVAFWMEHILTALEDLGLVGWNNAESFEEWGRRHRRGGELVLTELGLHWCQTRLGEYGFVFDAAGSRTQVTLADDAEAVVDLLASRLAVDVGSFVWAVMELGGPDEVAAAVGEWWRVDHPQVGAVLEALETAIPSPKVRRAAHGARFKLRNR